LIFVNKNCSNDPRVRCKSPFDLIKFLERDIDLEDELEECEGEFERMKLLKCKNATNQFFV
jgi:hypothetical protein